MDSRVGCMHSMFSSRRWVGLALLLIGPQLVTSVNSAPSSDVVARGAYLANAADCVACHTAKEGKPLAGGLAMNTPFGTIVTPNITPDKATGIGSWTDEQFYRVMHEGVGHRGEYLYPVMPFPWYTNVTRNDVMAIRAWLAAQPAVSRKREPNHLTFPFSVRAALLAWRTAFFKVGAFTPDRSQPTDVNRGAYLVNGLAHCGECHNARKVVGASQWQGALQGGVIDSWYAPNITSDVRDGIGAWSTDEIATYLKTGVSPGKGIALGPMAETVHSLSKLDDDDLHAIAAYLKSTAPVANGDNQKKSLFAGRDARGGEAYLNHCASCHGDNGKGLEGVIPPLDGNGAVVSKGPQNVINVVLGGVAARDRYAPMPAVGAGISDQDIADVTNFVRQSWGNAAPATAESGMVGTMRGAIDSVMNVFSTQACAPIMPSALAQAFTTDRDGVRSRVAALTPANTADRTNDIVALARKISPEVPLADLVNGLTAAYCSVVRADPSMTWQQKTLQLGQFSELVYAAASGNLTGLTSVPGSRSRRTAQK